MNENKQAVVTFASRNGNYINGMARLAESLRDRFHGAFISFTDEASIGSPKHSENNYAFKIYALQKAIDAGYTKLLWLDCSVYAVNQVQPIFDIIEKDGYFIQWSGWNCDEWTNKRTLDYFKTDGKNMPMFSSGVTGINMEHPIGYEFFLNWKSAMLHKQFNGSWKNHRHDQSCASIIANQLGMKQQEGNKYYHYKCEHAEPTEHTVFLLEGM